MDRYAYVNNSPMNFVDPSGHIACDGELIPLEECQSGGGTPGNGKGGRDEDHSNNPLLECGYDCTLRQVDHATFEQQSEWFITLADQEGTRSCSNTPAYAECEYSFNSVDNEKLLKSYRILLQAIETSELLPGAATGAIMVVVPSSIIVGILTLINETVGEAMHNDLLTYENTFTNAQISRQHI